MLKQIGAALIEATAQRRRARVRANSHEAGKCEAALWKPMRRQELRQIVVAAQRYDVAKKRPGARNGPLGEVALRILGLMGNIIHKKTGQLDPSIEYLMRMLGRARDTIVRALAALRTHGFIHWLRRFTPTGNAGERGPQVRQTSNAYRLTLPEHARAYLGKYGETPPLPEDVIDRRAEELADLRQAFADDRTLQALLEDENPVVRSLAKLEMARRKKRESGQQTGKMIRLFIEANAGVEWPRGSVMQG